MADKKRPSFENRIETVSVGETVYLSYESIIVTEIGIFVHIFSEVLFASKINMTLVPKEIIPITRIGSGFSQKNWKINKFLVLKHCLCIESEGEAENYTDKIEEYIFFPKPRKKEPPAPRLPKEMVISNNIENLEIQLTNLLTEELYEKAAKVRDTLKRLRKQQVKITKPLAT